MATSTCYFEEKLLFELAGLFTLRPVSTIERCHNLCHFWKSHYHRAGAAHAKGSAQARRSIEWSRNPTRSSAERASARSARRAFSRAGATHWALGPATRYLSWIIPILAPSAILRGPAFAGHGDLAADPTLQAERRGCWSGPSGHDWRAISQSSPFGVG
jgi:hypothetical protein